MHNWFTDRLNTVGGGLGGISAYLLDISLSHVFEICLFALIGSIIGEGVKFGFELVKKRKTDVK